MVLLSATIRICAPDRNARPDLHRGPGYVDTQAPSHHYPAVGVDVDPHTDLHPDLESVVDAHLDVCSQADQRSHTVSR